MCLLLSKGSGRPDSSIIPSSAAGSRIAIHQEVCRNVIMRSPSYDPPYAWDRSLPLDLRQAVLATLEVQQTGVHDNVAISAVLGEPLECFRRRRSLFSQLYKDNSSTHFTARSP